MSNKNMVTKIVGGALAITGLYLIYTYAKKNGWIGSERQMNEEKKVAGSIDDKTQPKDVVTPPKTTQDKSTKAGKYIVKISSGKLNLRPTPSTKLASIGSFFNGEEINARPSVVKGWSEVLDTSSFFPKVIGYVSSSYIVAK
jgi:hypothetical protein